MVHRFSDFATRKGPLEGKKRSIDMVLNIEILVTAFEVKESKFPDKCDYYTTIQYEIDGEKYVTFTGSGVLRKQLEDYEDKLPFLAVIRKVDRYYTFT